MLHPSDRFFENFGRPLAEDGTMWTPDIGIIGGGGGSPGVTFQWGGGSLGISLPGGGTGAPDVKRALSDLANSIEAQLQTNLQRYQAGHLDGRSALDNAWRLMDQFTQTAWQYGAQGQISAAERDRRIDPSRLRWDWIAYYIDPISIAETGAPAAGGPVGGPVGGVVGGPAGGSLPMRRDTMLLLLAAAAIIVLVKRK